MTTGDDGAARDSVGGIGRRGHRARSDGRGQSSRSAGRATAAALGALAAGALGAGPLRAQAPARAGADSLPAADAWIGSVAEDRLRDAALLGRRADGYLLRSASTLLRDAGATAAGPQARALLPAARVVSNSDVPFGLNDGALWAGRGVSALARAGAVVRWGRVRAVIAPEVAHSSNRGFDFIPSSAPERSPFASPWRVGTSNSIDLPTRFGDAAYTRLTLGQSSVAVRAGALEVGAGTENAVWGPGRWNALTLSANAEGFPHAFVRTARPVRTPIGALEARYLAGTLTPSTFLDTVVVRRYRAFGGLALALAPRGTRDLTVGVMRTVVAPVNGAFGAAGRVLDPILRWESPPLLPGRRLGADQLVGAFGRWVFPDDHAEVYAEWARQTTPHSVAEFLAAPQEGAAFTVGARALRPLGRGALGSRYLRFEIELTNTEQSVAFRDREVPAPFYAGRATLEGYTHRGQVLGAAVGPGASAQFAAVDHVTRAGSVGLSLGRVRWFNDALYAQPNANFFRHDVSTLLGVRAQRRLPAADVQGEFTWGRRYNYLFQNGFANPGGRRTVDVSNLTYALTVTPR